LSLGNPLGNAMANPLGLISKAAGGVKIQTGHQFGPAGSPTTARFPLKKINLNKSVVFANFQGAGSDGGNITQSFYFLSLEEEAITFVSQNAPSNGYWPVVSWTILEIESIKRITRVSVGIPGGTTSRSGLTPFPEGTNAEKTIVVPILQQTGVAGQQPIDACVRMTPTGFQLDRGLWTTAQLGVIYLCQIVEFE